MGYGQAHADGASVLVKVRPGVRGRVVRVDLTEGQLTAPDLRVRVTLTEDTPTAATRDQAWSVA
jgi:hypothetical protein